MKLIYFLSSLMCCGSVLGDLFVETLVNGGHRPHCGSRLTSLLNPGGTSSRDMFAVFQRLGRKAGHIAEKSRDLYVAYDDERIETPLDQTDLPPCLTKIIFENYPGISISTDRLITMLQSDLQSLLQADGILREMRTEESRYDEGIYSTDIDEILVRISRTICEMYRILRSLRANQITDYSALDVTMCTGKCRQARYHRDVHILMKIKQFTLSLRNKYTNLSTLFPLQ